ncbi:tRNA pseudouridine(38-40) synthase TruA [Malacoplasma iowae]|uniref:tRNA pseudouridine(38-40) synthase TruA n=1 Tax=Malacoplasma iowae TaxID=2116 RepID=UPI003872C53B|nr:tRNA pseudouridine(38-40) synthase TruA [Malacoplasma iowae]
MEKTYCVKVAYDGSVFSGWAKQNDNSIRTVQSCIENVLSEITKEKINIYGSGRTDKYVHAIDQCFHFKTKYELDKKILFKQMLIKQPEDIFFKSIKEVNSSFHSRFSIKKKTYLYKVNTGKFNIFERNYVLQYNKPIDIKKLKKASKNFIGEKNFLSYSTSESINSIRKIENIRIVKENDYVLFYFTGNGFLRSMIRMIVGTLLNHNENKTTIDDINYYLDNPKKGSSQAKADGCGLYLYKTVY